MTEVGKIVSVSEDTAIKQYLEYLQTSKISVSFMDWLEYNRMVFRGLPDTEAMPWMMP